MKPVIIHEIWHPSQNKNQEFAKLVFVKYKLQRKSDV